MGQNDEPPTAKPIPNLITPAELASLEACQTEADWDTACDAIKAARGGKRYPDDWWPVVNQSGMMARIFARFGASTEPTVTAYSRQA
jgi:hypothetical protein